MTPYLAVASDTSGRGDVHGYSWPRAGEDAASYSTGLSRDSHRHLS